MNIGIDITPLKSGNFLQHRVRGTGTYVKNLLTSLEKYRKENSYVPFVREEKLPKNLDVLHIPYFEPFFLTLPSRNIQRTVVTVHDLTPLVFPQHFPSGIKGRIKWEVQKRRLLQTDAIIADSESSKKDIIKYTRADPSKIFVVYLAAGEEFKKKIISPVEKKQMVLKYKLPESFLLYVGDVSWNKNLPRLIKAVKRVNIPLVIVGKALMEKKFDEKNQWNKDKIEIRSLIENDRNIFSIGFISENDLIKLYNLSTALILPSLYEGFGLTLLEAMRCGTATICSKEGSLPEVGGEASYYVDAYNEDSIASGIVEVFRNTRLREKLSKQGLIQAKNFSWEKVAEETVKVYKFVLKK